MNCPYCLSIARHPTAQEDLAWLSNVLLLRVSAYLQRAHCYPLQLCIVSSRHCSPRRCVPLALQTELT